MNKIILADSQAIFRAGTAKVLATHDELRIIAQCADLERLSARRHHVSRRHRTLCRIATPRPVRMRKLLETSNSRGIVIAENSDSASSYIQLGFRGVVFRNVSGNA